MGFNSAFKGLINKVIKTKCVIWNLYNFAWNISHSKKNLARYDQKRVLVFMLRACYSCQISMEFEFSQKIFENYKLSLTFKNRASYIKDVRPATIQMLRFIYIFHQL
jgi:hypothetical protein